jgi:hypothetical protein
MDMEPLVESALKSGIGDEVPDGTSMGRLAFPPLYSCG